MATTENTLSLLPPTSPVGLPEFMADDGRRSPDEQMQYMVGMAKKLTAKSPERSTDAARVLIHIKDNELYRKDHGTFEAFLEAEGLRKTTAYTTIAAVRRFPLEKIFEMGLTKARLLAKVADAETILAKGFDYLAEDGTVEHMAVLGTSTRAFQEAFKTRLSPPAATPAAPDGHSAEAATGANTEAEAGDQVAEGIEAQGAPDPASPSSETVNQELAPAEGQGDVAAGAHPAMPAVETVHKETAPAADPATAELSAAEAADRSSAGAEPEMGSATSSAQPVTPTVRRDRPLTKQEKKTLRKAAATRTNPGANHPSEAQVG
jgi:hypothetical protein